MNTYSDVPGPSYNGVDYLAVQNFQATVSTELLTSKQVADSISLLAADLDSDPFLCATQVCDSQSVGGDGHHPRTYVFDNYVADLQHLPRDDFVLRLVTLTKGEEGELLKVRSDLYEWCKATREDCPHGILIRRINSRKLHADPIGVKLAKDCYVLYQYKNGTATAELGDIISCRSTRQVSRSGSLPPVGRPQHEHDTTSSAAENQRLALNAQMVALHIEMSQRKTNEQALLLRMEQTEGRCTTFMGQISGRDRYLSKECRRPGWASGQSRKEMRSDRARHQMPSEKTSL